MSGCRIARVRDKATGRMLTVLPSVKREGFAATLVEHAAEIADDTAGMVGFVIIGVGGDGTYQVGSRLGRDGPFGPTLFATYLTEIIRREVTTNAAVDSFCKRTGLLPW